MRSYPAETVYLQDTKKGVKNLGIRMGLVNSILRGQIWLLGCSE